MNSYFQFWNIAEPVFVSRSNLYMEIPPFEPIKKRLLMQLQIGMKLQILTGKPACGKTKVIQAIANNLEVSEWDCLYCMVSSQTSETNSLTKRIMRFLDTSIDIKNQTNPRDLISRLEKIGKSKRKILIILDILDSLENNESLTRELSTLVDICIRHNLPMHFIAAEASTDENLLQKNGYAYQKLISKATSICQLPEINSEEFARYVGQYLSASHLPENLIPRNIVEKILEYADKDLKKSAMLLEALLIDCHIENDKKISSKNLNRILKQSALSGSPTQMRKTSEENDSVENRSVENRSVENHSEEKLSEECKTSNIPSEAPSPNKNNEIENEAPDDGETSSSISKKMIEVSASENGLGTGEVRGLSKTRNEQFTNDNDEIQKPTELQTRLPLVDEYAKNSEQINDLSHIEVPKSNEDALSSGILISHISDSQNGPTREEKTHQKSPKLDHNKPISAKNSITLAHQEQSNQEDHGIATPSLFDKTENGASTKNHSKDDVKKHLLGQDQAETKQESRQKRSRQNERKIRHKTEWNAPRISLAQLTKKA